MQDRTNLVVYDKIAFTLTFQGIRTKAPPPPNPYSSWVGCLSVRGGFGLGEPTCLSFEGGGPLPVPVHNGIAAHPRSRTNITENITFPRTHVVGNETFQKTT